MNKIILSNLPLDMQKPHTTSEPIVSFASCFIVFVVRSIVFPASPVKPSERCMAPLDMAVHFFNNQALNACYFTLKAKMSTQ